MADYAEWLRVGLATPDKNNVGLAKALGIDPSAVSRMLKGERQLKAHELEKAAAYIGIPPPGRETLAERAPAAVAANSAPELVELAKVIGEKIRQLRDRFRETQAVFGERFGVEQASVSRWEKGAKHEKHLAELANMTVPEFFHSDEPPASGERLRQSEHLVEALKLIERLCGPETSNDDPYRDIRVVVRLALTTAA